MNPGIGWLLAKLFYFGSHLYTRVSLRRLRCMVVDYIVALWIFTKHWHSASRQVTTEVAVGVPSDMIWGIIALNERVVGRGGLCNEITSTIGVKQGCPPSQHFLDYILMRYWSSLIEVEVGVHPYLVS